MTVRAVAGTPTRETSLSGLQPIDTSRIRKLLRAAPAIEGADDTDGIRSQLTSNSKPAIPILRRVGFAEKIPP